MTSTSKNARVAGLLYLVLVFVGPLRLIYIPTTLLSDSDPTVTANAIASHEMLFRLGMLSDVFGAVMLIVVTLAMYRLFEAVDRMLAVLVVILGGVMPAASYFFNVVNDAAALVLVRGADFLSVFDQPQRNALAMLFLHLHDQEIVAAESLWGLWLFPLAILVHKSRFLPRFLGVWLILNGFAFVAMCVTGLLWPQYADLVFRLGRPARLGEIAFVLWLVILGAKEPAARAGPGPQRDVRGVA
jgi:hypothetical protein